MNCKHTENDNDYSIRTVTKSFEIMEILSETQEGASLARIASKTELSKNVAFRILKTLELSGLIEQNQATCNYTLSLQSATFAQKMLKNMSVLNYAHPVLEQLANRLDEAVYLTVPKNDDDVLFLDMVDCNQQIKTASLLGRIVPFFTNAAGKVMKSLDSRDLLQRMFHKIGRKRGSIEFDKLDKELDSIRSKGVAVDNGGLGDGVVSIAVAIRDYSGKVVGAITLIAPAFRLVGKRIDEEIIPSLKEGADLLSGRFGYAPA